MVQWWDSGPGAEERAKKREEDARKRNSATASRLWQRPGQKSVITFISNGIIHFTEHNYQPPGGRWENYVCLEGQKTSDGKDVPCPFCLSKTKQDFSAYFGTIINHTGFKTKEGDQVRHIKQVLVLKGTPKSAFLKQIGMMKKAQGDKWDYNGTIWEVEREDKPKSHTPGIFYEYKGKVSKDKLIERMKKDGKEIEDWDLYMKPIEMEKLAIYLDPEQAYQFLRIPFPYTSGEDLSAESEGIDEFEFPPSTPGSEQGVDFGADEEEEEKTDAEEIEEYELLK